VRAANHNESLLLDRARTGDAAACEKLFAAQSGRAYRLAYRITGNREDAEDVVQDAFVRCFRAIAKHRGEASFSTWVMRIVANESIRLRQKRRRRQSRWFWMARSEGDTRGDGFAETVDATLTSGAVAECLERLPARDRTLLVMRYMEGYSAAEIGKLLEQPAGTIRSHLFRARQRLRDLLEPHLGGEGATP
jgi:RNA polymerase sigma-70 factor (ECF subfamily)